MVTKKTRFNPKDTGLAVLAASAAVDIDNYIANASQKDKDVKSVSELLEDMLQYNLIKIGGGTFLNPCVEFILSFSLTGKEDYEIYWNRIKGNQEKYIISRIK